MILVVGGTGDLGRRIVRRLRERGEAVRCLVRPPTDAAAIEQLQAEIARGDLLDPATLHAACAGVGTVICTATAIARSHGGTGPSIHELDLGGPDALTRNETIELVETLTGSKLKRQRMPRPLVRVGMRVLARRKPALASVFGIGLVMDLQEARWDERPHRERMIEPRPTADYLREQAASAL